MRLDSREALILSGHLEIEADGAPIPDEVVRDRLAEVLRRHRILGGLCQACGERIVGTTGRCFKSAVALRWHREHEIPLPEQP